MTRPASLPSGNTGHTFWSALTAAWTFHSTGNTGGADADDIKGSNDATLANAAALDDTIGLDLNATIDKVTITDISCAGAFSVVFRCKMASAPSNDSMLWGDLTGNDYLWMDKTGANSNKIIYHSPSDFSFVVAASEKTTLYDYCLTLSADSGGSQTATLHRKLPASSTWTTVGTSSPSTSTRIINNIGSGFTSDSFGFIGDVEYFMVFNGTELTLANLDADFADPYDILGTAAASDAVAIDTFSRVWQHTANSVSIPLTGTYSGATADAVQVKVYLSADDSTVVDWADIDATLAGGTWSGSVNVPAGGPYYIEARLHDSGDSVLATSSQSSTLLVGDVFLATGQSNMMSIGDNSQSYAGTETAWMVDETGTIANLASPWTSTAGAGGSWGCLLATLIEASESIPTIWIVNAVSDTKIASWEDDPAASRWTAIQSQLTTLDPNAIKACLWLQGESDAIDGTLEATYKTAEAGLATAVAGLAGSPPLISACLAELSAGATADETDAIQKAKLANWDDASTEPGPFPMPQNLTEGLHYTDDNELAALAAMWWLSIEDECYGGANGRGPRLSTAVTDGTSNDLVLTFDRDLDLTDTTYTSTIVTVDNDDGTARTVSSVTRTGTRTVTVVMSGPLDGTSPTVTYGAGETLSGSTVVKTDAIALPATINTLTEHPLYAESFFDEAVTVTPDAIPPALDTAAITTGGTAAVLTFTEADSPPLLPLGGITGFSVSASGGAASVIAASRTGNTEITLTLSRVIETGETVTVSYASGNVTDSASSPNSLVDFAGSSVTNNSAVVFPTESQVLTTVDFGPTGADYTGNVVLPDANEVLATAVFGPSSSIPGNYATLGASEVLDTATFGVGGMTAGTYHAPEASEVISTAVFGVGSGTSGTVVLPAVGDVESGVTFGAGSALTGTFAVPTEAQVADGIGFGAGGTEFTGTLTGASGSPAPLSTVTIVCVDQEGALEEGVVIRMQMTQAPSGDLGYAYDATEQATASDENGIAQLVGIRGATYRIRRGVSEEWATITMDDDATTSPPSFVGTDP